MFARGSAVPIRVHSPTSHTIPQRRLIVIATTALACSLGACSHDVSAPEATKPITPSATARFSLSGDDARTVSAWNGRKIFIKSWQGDSNGYPLCLDIPFGIVFNGQDVNSYPCQFGVLATNQQFVVQIESWIPTSIPGFSVPVVVIKSVLSQTLCLDMRGGTANGAEHLQLFTCHSGSNQRFAIPIASPYGTGHAVGGRICTRVSNNAMVLDVPLPATPGTFVQQYPKYADPAVTHHWNQMWSFWDVEKKDYVQAAMPPGSNDWYGVVLC
jgi:hypothetical protein